MAGIGPTLRNGEKEIYRSALEWNPQPTRKTKSGRPKISWGQTVLNGWEVTRRNSNSSQIRKNCKHFIDGL